MLSLEEATLKMLQEDLQEETDKEIIDKPQSVGATMKDMYNQLDQTEGITNVEGLVDDILVVTDPEVTSEEYDEVIERAQEIVEDTPEGNVPFDEEYVGQYLLTCPICGTTFVSQQMLEPGATCPACMEVPESFVVKGKIDTDENVAIDNGLQVDEEQKEETEAVPDTTTIEDTEEPVEEEDIEKQTASKEIPEGNKLQETINESKTIKTEDTYEDGIFYEIEAALMEAGLNPVRFTEDGVMTNNLGWTVRGKDGTKQQITCDGSYLSESKKQEDYWQDVKDGVCSNCHKALDSNNTYIIDGRQVCGSCKTNIEQDKLDNEDTEPEKRMDDFNDYYESKDVKTEDTDGDRLPVEGDGIEVIVTENSVGYLLRGLIIDHKNKQFQYVLGQSLPLGKYKRVSKNTIRNTINDLQNEEYKEYKGKDSIELEESVEYAKFAKFKKLV